MIGAITVASLICWPMLAISSVYCMSPNASPFIRNIDKISGGVLFLVILSLIIFYEITLAKQRQIPRDKKRLWAVAIFFIVGMPVFFYLYLWKPNLSTTDTSAQKTTLTIDTSPKSTPSSLFVDGTHPEKPWIAAILNFLFWGAGYIYLKEYLLGIILLLLWGCNIFSVLLLFFKLQNVFIIAFYQIVDFSVAILLAIDGYKRSKWECPKSGE
mgnify:FL=1